MLAPLLLTLNQRLFASGRIGPLWLAFGPLWAWYRPKPRWSWGALAWGVAFAPLWFWTSPLVRFLLPVLALWSTLLAAILLNLMQQRIWVRWVVIGLTALWIGFALFSSVKGTLLRLPVNLGLRSPATALHAATGLEGVYSYVDFEHANDIAGPLVVFNTAGFYLTRPALLAGDLGNNPVSQLNARFSGAHCGVVHMLLPDSVRPQPDAWVADKIRPWLAQHNAQEVYRCGPVAIYRVDGCAR